MPQMQDEENKNRFLIATHFLYFTSQSYMKVHKNTIKITKYPYFNVLIITQSDGLLLDDTIVLNHAYDSDYYSNPSLYLNTCLSGVIVVLHHLSPTGFFLLIQCIINQKTKTDEYGDNEWEDI